MNITIQKELTRAQTFNWLSQHTMQFSRIGGWDGHHLSVHIVTSGNNWTKTMRTEKNQVTSVFSKFKDRVTLKPH